MENYLRYVLISTACLSVSYLTYFMFLKKELRFRHVRYFLLVSMLLSLCLPLSKVKLQVEFREKQFKATETTQQPEAGFLLRETQKTSRFIPFQKRNKHRYKADFYDALFAWTDFLWFKAFVPYYLYPPAVPLF
ncbi:MAG: hypothetical protein HC906_02735 [Bacteroidales bacterium]|nr:hypothetical protein [Bacteroidales bacterium]